MQDGPEGGQESSTGFQQWTVVFSPRAAFTVASDFPEPLGFRRSHFMLGLPGAGQQCPWKVTRVPIETWLRLLGG